jgi:hypothetical protein
MTIIDQAKEIVEGDREKTYGSPGINLKRIADQWSCYLNQKHGSEAKLSEQDVCWMMVLLKMARQIHSYKDDNLVDAIGYIALIDKVGNRE